ncbi:MAG: ABC transporter permease [Oscillospiraceae bacterium]|nr:ABC transporter permease [Oscillospiraceae bacterium]
MYIIQNAFANILRNRGRNILLAIIILAIITTSVTALIINNTSAAVIEDYQFRFSSEAFIQLDIDRLTSSASNGGSAGGNRVFSSASIPQMDAELQLMLTDSAFLKESLATGSVRGNSGDIRAIDQNDEDETDPSQPQGIPGAGGMAFRIGGDMSNFQLLGDQWESFTEGVRSLESGRFPETDNECVLSVDLAEANGVEIGNVIHFTALLSAGLPEDFDVNEAEDGDVMEVNGIDYTVSVLNRDFGIAGLNREVTYELTVTGLYYDLNDAYENEMLSGYAYFNNRNEVLTTLGTLLQPRQSGESGVQVNVRYFLADPAYIGNFEAEAREKGLSDAFLVTTDERSYNTIVKPVVELKKISLIFMFVVLGLGAVILLLLTSISIRERKYEIGVLRAMGMKKSKVALGLWCEMLAITAVCLAIGLGAGAVLSQPVSDMILVSQVEAAQEQNSAPGGFMTVPGGGGGGPVRIQGSQMGGARIGGGFTANAQPLDEMTVSLDIATLFQIIGIALALATAAALAGVTKITKYEPIKILMERN